MAGREDWLTIGRYRVTLEFDGPNDVDNVAKCVLDGLKGIAFEDDRMVEELYMKRTWMPDEATKIWIQRL